MTVKEAIQSAAEYLGERHLRAPRQDAELLVASILQQDRTFLYTYPERRLSPSQKQLFHQWLAKRGEHYPLQYLRGTQEFYGRQFRVRPGVFIPRPETELVLETALAILRESEDQELFAADIGTGSGCIAITLACEEPRVVVTATDISAGALRVARRNAEVHHCLDRIEFRAGQTLEPLKGHDSRYHLIVSNPPYVSHLEKDSVDISVDKYEPSEAVFAGESGQEVYRQLFCEAQNVLRPQGKLVVELGCDGRESVSRLARENGWVISDSKKDLAGKDRCAIFQQG